MSNSPKAVQFVIDPPISTGDMTESLVITTLDDDGHQSPEVVSYSSKSGKMSSLSPLMNSSIVPIASPPVETDAESNDNSKLYSKIASLEAKNCEYLSRIDEMSHQIEQFALLRKQTAVGFKSQRLDTEAKILSAVSTKSATFSVKSPGPSLVSSKNASTMMSPVQRETEKDARIKELECELARQSHLLQAQNSQIEANQSSAQQDRPTSEVEILRKELEESKKLISELEIQNSELRHQAEQFSLLRSQSSTSFKFVRAQSTKFISAKSPKVVPEVGNDDENV